MAGARVGIDVIKRCGNPIPGLATLLAFTLLCLCLCAPTEAAAAASALPSLLRSNKMAAPESSGGDGSALGKRRGSDMDMSLGSPDAKRANTNQHSGLDLYNDDGAGGDDISEHEEDGSDGAGDGRLTKPGTDGGKRHNAIDANARMHGRNRYLHCPPDFTAIARKDAEFASHVTWDTQGAAHLDWKQPNASLALTKALLKHDFSLQWHLPDGYLCPPVPQRCNYLHWIEDLVAGQLPATLSRPHHVPVPAVVRGIDIGVGANCIYPLLGTRMNPGWTWVGSEADPKALDNAAALVQQNGLAASVALRLVGGTGRPLLDVVSGVEGGFDFSMCNPPFFGDMSEARGGKRVRACAGSVSELVTEGGEVAFVQKMIEDSHKLQGRVRVYTTMLGHKASLKACTALAKKLGATRLVETEFFQGVTVRWGLAWSFVERDAHLATHRFISELSCEAVAQAVNRAVMSVPGSSFAFDQQASGDWSNPGCHPSRRNGARVCWRAVGHGAVTHETWTRRARRGNAPHPHPAGLPLFKFAILLEAIGADAARRDADVEAAHPLLRHTEWAATIYWVRGDNAGGDAASGPAGAGANDDSNQQRLFDSYSAQVFRGLPGGGGGDALSPLGSAQPQ